VRPASTRSAGSQRSEDLVRISPFARWLPPTSASRSTSSWRCCPDGHVHVGWNGGPSFWYASWLPPPCFCWRVPARSSPDWGPFRLPMLPQVSIRA